jgi:hypothetical protein
MSELHIKRVVPHYENFQVLIGKRWVFVTPEILGRILSGVKIDGEIVKKRTRTWLEVNRG